MRISDWSSDVCSSDLLAGISALRNAALDAAGEPLELALGDDVDHARDRIRTVGRRGAVAHHLNLIDDVVGDRVEVDEVARAVIGQRIICHAHAIEQHQRRVGAEAAQRYRRGAAGERARSEEHTSELQSLMRLSYAVFSLKK